MKNVNKKSNEDDIKFDYNNLQKMTNVVTENLRLLIEQTLL